MRLLPLFLLLLTACTMKAERKPIAEQQLLFILHADSARLDLGEDPYNGSLTLHKVNDSVAFFSERPNRRAGSISLKKFLAGWDQGRDNFDLQPPNAGLIFFSPSNSPKVSTAHYSELNLVLHNPRYDSKRDTLRFDVSLLGLASSPPEGNLLEPTLFIDSRTRR